ncbi:MAG TPA: carboxypeptidase regulatory-like domain-containing protein [Pyrinomonadaceae bacterium]|jgi:inhibitor of cysteine peptidase|nr:carboxypeptidase regulatory-like domain-containing protein [Pyrinomonadaceae bacterium]
MGRKLTLTVSLCLLAALTLAAGSRAKARPQQGVQEPGGANDAPASLNLKDFGATGDGVTDDSPALQAALDALAAAGGGSLFVPEGRYAILTPVAKSFAGLNASITILGVPSDTTVPPPTAAGDVLSLGLDLKSEFRPRTGNRAMLSLAGLRGAAFKDIAFMGTPGVETDASYTLYITDIDDASLEHCEFYGLSSGTSGSDVMAVRSNFRITRSVFLGCTANSGAYTSVVQNLEWKGFTIEESIFLDYGQRGELFSKTGIAAPFSWVELGNAAAVTNDSPRREAVFRSVFLDEGGYFGIASLPARSQPPSAPVDLVYVTGLRMNVSNLGTTGNYLSGMRAALVENSAYGWSTRTDAAIWIEGAVHGILDRVETTESATRLRADAATARLTVIDSVYTDLASFAQQTVVIKTVQPDEDPVQYVRGRFTSALGRAPDAAAHFYWSDKILRCGADAACVATGRASLDAYLAKSPSANFSITGKVTNDNNNAPVAGASVVLTGSQTAATTTDASGLYHFSNLPTSGVYTVTVSAASVTFASPSRTFTTPAGDITADFAGVLKRFVVSGRVTDDTGAALAGATLKLTGSQAATTTSDAQGNYSFTGVGAGGNYTVTPSKTDYVFAPVASGLTNLSADSRADFKGTPTIRSISGVIVGTNNAPLQGVTVSLTGSQTATATTAPDGSYRFDRLPAGGSYVVKPKLFGHVFTPDTRGFSNLSADVRGDFVGTFVEHKITGRVTKSDGTAVSGVAVALAGSKSASVTTDSNGDYTLNAPTGGDYTVTPSKTDYTFSPTSRAFNALASDQTAAFTATPGTHAIRGRVTGAGGSALSGATLTLSGSKSATATTDANGDYSFTGLPSDGTYTVTPSKANYAFTPPSQTFTQPTTDKTANFAGALVNYKISGRVNEGTPGLPGVTVSLTGSATGTTTTDANGLYSFTVKAEGTYTVTTSLAHYGFTPPSQTFANLGGDKTADFNAARIRHTVSGRVTKPDGSALAGASVALTGTQTATATTDAQGNFSFASLAGGGDYTVTPTMRHYTFAPASQQFKDLGANQTATFVGTLDTHAIAGRVTKPDGSGLAGATVTLAGSKSATATTDSNGGYSFTSLDGGGSYTVTASKTNYTFAPPARTFDDLSSNQTADFAATLVNFRITGRVADNGNGVGGVAVTLTGSRTASATTAADGSYSFTVSAEGNYTVTAAKTHYTFAPQSQTFDNLGGDKTADFAATLLRFAIHGRVTDVNGGGMQGVTVSLTGSQTATAADGSYSFPSLASDGTYTVTPSLKDFAFTPASKTFAGLDADASADFTGALVRFRITGRVTEKGTGLAGVAIDLAGSHPLLGADGRSVLTGADGSYSFDVTSGGTYLVTPSKKNYTFSPSSQSFDAIDGDRAADFDALHMKVVEFGSASLSVGEGGGSLAVTVTRAGDTSEEVSAVYEVNSGTALRGADLVGSAGRVTFAPGETTKTFTIFITDDSLVEGAENFSVALTPEGDAVAGERNTVAVTIDDNDNDPTAQNAIDEDEFFVRQHYRDFLGRDPDASGLAFWKSQITQCGSNAACREAARINVSAAFFLAIEFQQSGFFVHKAYKAAYGRAPERLLEFTLDSREISSGIIVGELGWEQKLETHKATFVSDFVARTQFEQQFPLAMTPAQFVSALDENTGNSLTDAERSAAAQEFAGAANTEDLAARARVLRLVLDNGAFHKRETNPAFVLMQYYGYLRRAPDDPPNTNLDGYNFWLKKLEDFGGDFKRAEMVKAFLDSDEYRKRFGK